MRNATGATDGTRAPAVLDRYRAISADGLSSSIKPGNIDPPQCEALTIVAAQVMGNHVAVTNAGAQGRLELNVFKPVIIQNALQSCRLLADCVVKFAAYMVDKLEPNRDHIAANRAKSLMLVTALNPRIGYDRAVKIGKLALAENITLKQAAEKLVVVRPEDFDRWVVPAEMTMPGATLPGGGG
jgi:fumarate hydratase class II